MNSIVVHYQELALKGKNRPWFLGRLVRNLRRALSDLDVRNVRALMGRVEVVLGPGAVPAEISERISAITCSRCGFLSVRNEPQRALTSSITFPSPLSSSLRT